jgi:site-specific recombinase XerD
MTKRPRASLRQTLEAQIQNIAPGLRPSSVRLYRDRAKRFISYVEATYPEIGSVSQLRRHPHILGWLRNLCERQPPLANKTRIDTIIAVRRLLNDLAAMDNRSPRESLFQRGDLPHLDRYLPKPLSPEDDQLLQRQLSKRGTLHSNALLLMRATGMRVGECLNLTVDSLRELGRRQWVIRVPLGKLHTERWVPVDDDTCSTFRTILSLRHSLTSAPPWLLLQKTGRPPCYERMRHELITAAVEAGCSCRLTTHQLRHSYATSMLRAGASLPVVQQLLGHRSIEMTLRYVQVSQVDLQREYHLARQKMTGLHAIPEVSKTEPRDIPSLRQYLNQAKHLLEMYRRQQSDGKARVKLARLINRLAKISAELCRIDKDKK